MLEVYDLSRGGEVVRHGLGGFVAVCHCLWLCLSS